MNLIPRWVDTLSQSRCLKGSGEISSLLGLRLSLTKTHQTGLACPIMLRRFLSTLIS